MKLPKLLIALIVVVELVVVVPHFLNEFMVPPGSAPAHLGYTAPDHTVYENYITQAKQGRLTFEDRMTTEPQKIGILNMFWLAVGFLARIFNLLPWQAILLTRLILAPLVILIVWYATSFIIKEERDRILASWFMTFLCGLGFFISDLTIPDPADFLVPEATINTIISTSPHIMASFVLLVLVYLCFYRWTERFETKWLAYSAIAGATLLQFHPYYAPIIAITTFVWLIVIKREWSAKHFGQYLLMGVALAVPIAYHAWTMTDAFTTLRYSTNHTPSAPLWMNLFSFALPLIIAYQGWKHVRTERFAKFAALWLAIGMLMMYLPVRINQRFLESLIVPLGLFAYLGIKSIKSDLMRQVIAVFLMLGGGINIIVIGYAVAKRAQPADLPKIIEHVQTWPQAVFLGNPDWIALLTARSHHIGFNAHWSETVAYLQKTRFAQSYVDFKMPPEVEQAMNELPQYPTEPGALKKQGINFVLINDKPSCIPETSEVLHEGRFRICKVN